MINPEDKIIEEFREKFKIAHSYLDQDAGYLDEETAKEVEQFLKDSLLKVRKDTLEEVVNKVEKFFFTGGGPSRESLITFLDRLKDKT